MSSKQLPMWHMYVIFKCSYSFRVESTCNNFHVFPLTQRTFHPYLWHFVFYPDQYFSWAGWVGGCSVATTTHHVLVSQVHGWLLIQVENNSSNSLVFFYPWIQYFNHVLQASTICILNVLHSNLFTTFVLMFALRFTLNLTPISGNCLIKISNKIISTYLSKNIGSNHN